MVVFGRGHDSGFRTIHDDRCNDGPSGRGCGLKMHRVTLLEEFVEIPKRYSKV